MPHAVVQQVNMLDSVVGINVNKHQYANYPLRAMQESNGQEVSGCGICVFAIEAVAQLKYS